MAKILKNYEKQKATPGPKSKYPWAKWFDGKTRLLEEGEDYLCTSESMEDNVRKAARKMGIEITVHQEEKGIVIHPKREKKTED